MNEGAYIPASADPQAFGEGGVPLQDWQTEPPIHRSRRHKIGLWET